MWVCLLVTTVVCTISLLVEEAVAEQGGYHEKLIYCGGKHAEPTIREIMGSILPNEVFDAMGTWDHDADSPIGEAVQRSLEKVSGWSIPLSTFINDGKYIVDFDHRVASFGFNSVYLMQQQTYIQRFLCGLESVKVNLRFMCDCPGGTTYQESLIFDPKDTQYNGFCVSNPCTESSFKTGHCEFYADPFRSSCVVIEPIRTMDSSVDIIGYFQTITSYADVVYGLDAVEHSKKIFEDFTMKDISSWKLSTLVQKFLPFFPFYLTNLVIGFYLVTRAEDLMDYDQTIHIMKGMYGIALAFIGLLYMMYWMASRVKHSISSSYPISSMMVLPALMAMGIPATALAIFNPKILHAALEFWETGKPFGIPWLGKAYFAGSIFLSYAISWKFDLFNKDVIEVAPKEVGGTWVESHYMSWTVMMYSVKMVGFLFLHNASSSNEFTWVIMLLAIFYYDIQHAMWSMFLSYSALNQTPTYSYLAGGRLTKEEMTELSKRSTKKALEDLRQHLQKTPAALHRHIDMMTESDKSNSASLLKRFSEGTYPGVPYTVSGDDDNDSAGSRLMRVIGFLLLAAAVTGGLYTYALLEQNEFVNSEL